jgi:hypothetical protein
MGEDLHLRAEYMCTNTKCDFSSRIIHEFNRPLQKKGYITVHMLQKKKEQKSGFRRLFGELAGQVSLRL